MDSELSQRQKSRLRRITSRIFAGFWSFRIFPPREVAHKPAILRDEDAGRALLGTKWWLTIDDGGSEELLTFCELLALINYIRHVTAELHARRQCERVGAILLPNVSLRQRIG
jgi:hypothetical protein